MQQGRGGMGSRKHGVSGYSGKSPKLRMHLALEAKKNDKKVKPSLEFSSVKEAFASKKGLGDE